MKEKLLFLVLLVSPLVFVAYYAHKRVVEHQAFVEKLMEYNKR